MKKIWKGNLAIVEGAIAGGLDAYFGYPITPQNEIPEYMSLRMRQEGKVFLQAESEPAAINMVFGAALTGKRAMTSSSSPGVSLMQEGISYLVGCELPVVIVNVQRGGPGLGNISGAQGDYFQTVKGGGHGDYKLLTFTPASVHEMYTMTRDAFDLAFKYRAPVMLLLDGFLGQMLEPAEIEDSEKLRVKSEELRSRFATNCFEGGVQDLGWNLTGCKGRESRMIRSLYMGENELEEHNYKLFRKFDDMQQEVDWEEHDVDDADVILVGYGTSARINFDVYREARKKGLKVGCFRLKTVYPFPSVRLKELAQKSRFLVVEMSMGQMVEDVKLAVNGITEVDFYGRPAGGLPEEDKIMEKIRACLEFQDL